MDNKEVRKQGEKMTDKYLIKKEDLNLVFRRHATIEERKEKREARREARRERWKKLSKMPFRVNFYIEKNGSNSRTEKKISGVSIIDSFKGFLKEYKKFIPQITGCYIAKTNTGNFTSKEFNEPLTKKLLTKLSKKQINNEEIKIFKQMEKQVTIIDPEYKEVDKFFRRFF